MGERQPENLQIKPRKERREMRRRASDTQGVMGAPNACATGSRKRVGIEAVFKERMSKNFPKQTSSCKFKKLYEP